MRVTSKASAPAGLDRHSSTFRPPPAPTTAPGVVSTELRRQSALKRARDQNSESTLSTPESAHASRPATSRDSSPPSAATTQTQSSSATSPVASTSNEEACAPCSSSHSKADFAESTSRTATASAASHTTSSSTSSPTTAQLSSSTLRNPLPTSKTSPKTSSPSSPSSGPSSTASAAARDAEGAPKAKRPKRKAAPPTSTAAPPTSKAAKPPNPRRRVPWFEPHHRALFDELPPPSQPATAVPKGSGWWAQRTWTELPQGSDPGSLRPLRPRLGNFGAFKGAGPYAREHWVRDKEAQQKRNAVGGCGRGKKRQIDGEQVPKDPDYLRTIKCRVRFVGEPAERNRQARCLKSWMGSCRYTYNAALRGVREGMPLKKEELRERYVTARSCSNKGVQPTTEEGEQRKQKRDARKVASRSAHGYEVGELLASRPWLTHTPNDLRDGAVLDLVDAENAMRKKAQLARERGDDDFQRWTLSLKDKHDPSAWTIKVQHRFINKAESLPRPTATKVCDGGDNNPNAKRRNWTKVTIFPRFKCADGRPLGAFWLSEDFTAKFGAIEHDCRITRDRRGKYFMHIPVRTPLPPTVPEERREPCALDPGVRTFQAVHSRSGHGTYADGDFERVLEPLCQQMAKLQGARDRVVAKWEDGQWTVEGEPKADSWRSSLRSTWRLDYYEDGPLQSYRRVRRRLEDRLEKLRRRLTCLVDELHRRVAKDLCARFDTILIPVFETGKMARWDQENGGRRKLLPKTVRAMLGWAHYRFREKLKHKALMMGKEVVVVDESYTTKGCSRCGEITEIGGAKVFRCGNASCGLCAPRDPKSARDILAKHVVSCAANEA